MIEVSLKEIALSCNGVFHSPKDYIIGSIATDSRKAEKGCLFAAIKGEKTDGYLHIDAAVNGGAVAVLTEKAPRDESIPYILVDNVEIALRKVAAYILEKSGVKKVGIGGSVGKTSTRSAVASVLGERFSLLETQGNFNNLLGVPFTIFNIEKENQVAVLEMGIDDFGQMEELSQIVKPDVAVLTNIGDCHLNNLGDRNGVFKAKTQMFTYMNPDGAIVLNGDDRLLKTIKGYNAIKPVFVGLSKENEIYASHITEREQSQEFTVHTPGGSFSVAINKPGVHEVYNSLVAVAVGLIFGMTLREIKKGLESQKRLPGRLDSFLVKDCEILDGAYNANPMSMKAALSVLFNHKGERIAILGDMGELGDNEIQFHRQVGEYIASGSLDRLYCIGDLARYIGEEAEKNKKTDVKYYPDTEDFIKKETNLTPKGGQVLVKASHFMEFDKIIRHLRGKEKE